MRKRPFYPNFFVGTCDNSQNIRTFAAIKTNDNEDMIVCIAEKPSVARDIARIIGATSSRDGYMEGNGYQVTWTFGHLCTQIGRAHV